MVCYFSDLIFNFNLVTKLSQLLSNLTVCPNADNEDALSMSVYELQICNNCNVSIAPHLRCPITQDVFQDPVVAAGTIIVHVHVYLNLLSPTLYVDGHTYERSAMMSWLMEGKRSSPVTNATLPHTTLTQNHCIRTIINARPKQGLS